MKYKNLIVEMQISQLCQKQIVSIVTIINQQTQNHSLWVVIKNNINSKRVENILKILLFFSFLSTPLFAIENSDSSLYLLKNGLQSWIPTVKSACLWVFFTLTIINLVWTFGLMALSGFEFNEFLATLIKKIMYIGVFIFLFNVDFWLTILFQSFSQLAANVSGISITPSNIITEAFKIVLTILNSLTITEIAISLFKILSGLIILIAFVFMGIDLLIVYVKFYLMNVIIYFALALGGLEHYKQIGLNPVITAVKVGVELFAIQGIMALAINSIQSAFNELTISKIDFEIVLQILVMSLIFAVITKLVPTVIEAVFQGTIGDSSGAAGGFKAVAAMLGGMAAGAVAGSIGTSRAINAAKDLHLAEGGSGGMDMVKGIAKNLASTGGEHLKENFTKGRMPNDIANRLQEKVRNVGTTSGNISGGGVPPSEPYQSGIGL